MSGWTPECEFRLDEARTSLGHALENRVYSKWLSICMQFDEDDAVALAGMAAAYVVSHKMSGARAERWSKLRAMAEVCAVVAELPGRAKVRL